MYFFILILLGLILISNGENEDKDSKILLGIILGFTGTFLGVVKVANFFPFQFKRIEPLFTLYKQGYIEIKTINYQF